MAFKRSFAVVFVLAASVLASPHSGNYASKGKEGSCKESEFWYPTKSCCLPHGGTPAPPPPPPGKSCPPTTWYWHTEKSCCVPKTPPPANPPPPQCSNGHEWNKATQCCEPGSSTPTYSHSKPSQTPYGGYGGYTPPSNGGYGSVPNPPTAQPPKYEPPKYEPPKYEPSKTSSYGDDSNKKSSYGDDSNKKSSYGSDSNKKSSYGSDSHYKKRSAAALCPRAYEACPVSGLTGNEYECLDTTVELRSCGGCASTGKGRDCTAIKGAWNVGCEVGSCAVYTCELGYKVASDGKSCIKT